MSISLASQSAALPRTVPVLCFLIAMIEGFDMQAAGVVASRLGPALHLGPGQMGLFFSAATIGLIAGSVVGGRLADRYGRRAVLFPSVILFGIFSLVTAMSFDFSSLFAARTISGIGIGAALPSMVAIVAEGNRPGRQAASVALLYAGMPTGGAVASLIAALNLFEGWKPMLIIGGIVPLLIAPLVLLFVSNTAPARRAAMPSTPLAALFGQGAATVTLLLWVGFFCAMVVHGLLLNWLPSLLIARGIAHAAAGQVQVLFNLAGAAGSIFAGRALDAFSRSGVVTMTFLGLAGALLILAGAPPWPDFMFLAGALVGLGSMSVQGIIYGLTPRYYPAAMRATGVGAAVAVGRAGSVAGPLLAGGLVAAGSGSAFVLATILPVALIAGTAILLLVRKKAAAPLPNAAV
jgi:AAHS family 3-hydroxyphenylpropionic acid transporter